MMSTPVVPNRIERATLADLLRELFGKFSDLLNTQILLVKTEIKVETRKLALAAIFGLIALSIGFLTLMLLAVSLILLLDKLVNDLSWAALLTTLVFLVVTAGCAGLSVWEVRRNSAEVDVET